MKHRSFLLSLLIYIGSIGFIQGQSLNYLKIHQGSHFNQGSKSFFWLGDAYNGLLFQTEDKITNFLTTRAHQGFNVIQGVSLFKKTRGEWQKDGLGNKPFVDGKLTVDNRYLENASKVAIQANKLGIYVALTPLEPLQLDNYDTLDLYNLGINLGKYFGDFKNVLWVVAYDAAGIVNPYKVKALAKGLKLGSKGLQLISVMPNAKSTSALGKYMSSDGSSGLYYYHTEEWMSFNMLNSQQGKNFKNYNLVSGNYNLTPAKPTIEACYACDASLSMSQTEDTNLITDYDLRKGAYWAVFSGASGFGYCQTMLNENTWDGTTEKLKTKTTEQLVFLKNLMLSRPLLERVPDQSIISKYRDTSKAYLQDFRAIRDLSNKFYRSSYLMVYYPYSASIDINTTYIDSKFLNIYWFNPSNGKVVVAGKNIHNGGTVRYTSPIEHKDWVLVIDDASKKYPLPGFHKKK